MGLISNRGLQNDYILSEKGNMLIILTGFVKSLVNTIIVMFTSQTSETSTKPGLGSAHATFLGYGQKVIIFPIIILTTEVCIETIVLTDTYGGIIEETTEVSKGAIFLNEFFFNLTTFLKKGYIRPFFGTFPVSHPVSKITKKNCSKIVHTAFCMQ